MTSPLTLSFGSDHGGLALRRGLSEALKAKGYAILDRGTAADPLAPIFVSSGKAADVQVQQKDGKASITLPGFTGALLKQK